MTPDRFKDGIQWWMDTTRPMSEALFPNPPQWHIDTGNLVRLVPQRPWVGLTDDEIADCMDMSIQKTCQAIEAKLKEKNT
jgi:hypothetical protein